MTMTSTFSSRYHAVHKDIYDWFDIDFDKFGRTSTPQQTEICQSIFKQLLDRDHLSENVMEQVMTFPHLESFTLPCCKRLYGPWNTSRANTDKFFVRRPFSAPHNVSDYVTLRIGLEKAAGL